MEKKLQKKDFIRDRGFKKSISPFKEIIEKRGWRITCQHMPSKFSALVREFCTNMVDRKDTQCYVRGKWVSFNRHDINQLLKLGKLSNGTKFKELKKNPDYQKIVKTLTIEKGEWQDNKKYPHESIARGSLIEEAKVWFYFLSLTLLPSKHVRTMRQDEVILLYFILKGHKISLGKAH